MKPLLIIFSIIGFSNCFSLKSRIECGVPAIKPDTSTNIAGGKDAIPYSWPWQVAVFSTEDGEEKFVNGATLISNQWIMSSAGSIWNKPENYMAKLGVFDKDENGEAGEVLVKIAEIHFHYNYSQWDLLSPYDIALLKLEKPVEFTDHISPICLPKTKDEAIPAAGTTVFLSGWGHIGPIINDTTKTLQQIALPILPTDNCTEKYPALFNTDTQFCTGTETGGFETCYGDDGGPVAIQEAGIWKQVGIITRIGACSGLESVKLGIKSKVSAYLDFIQDIVTDL